MPNTRITGLTEDTTPADDDLVATVDVSDTTQSAQGSTKRVQAQNLVVKKLRTSTGPAVLTVGAVADGEILKRSGSSIIGAAVGGGGVGDVVGPAGATDNALARFDTTTGKLIQNSPITVDDNGAVTVPEIAAPGTPAAGKVAVYAKADGKLYIKDDTGAETDLSGGGGTTINPTNNRIPKRTDATTFGDSFLAHDAGNSRTESIQHFVLDTAKILGYGDAALARKNVGVLRVVSDTAFAPASIISETAALAFPGGTPTPWASSGMNFRYVATGNFTLGNPGGGASDGYRFTLMIVQDATGSRVITWSSAYKFAGGTLPTLTTAANAVDIFEFLYYSSTAFCIGQFLDVK